MFNVKRLRLISLMTLVFFIFFIGTADLSLAKPQEEEDALAKARRLYQEGDYEGSIKLLSDFIEKLKAMVEQKKNVAEAFYLLAKIYFEVGDDSKVDENLGKVFETYPTFEKEESNFGFRDRVKQARENFLQEKEKEAREKEEELKEPEPEPEPRIIEQPTVKEKKKKFPVLLVVGGIVVVAVAAILLLKKKKDEYDIRGAWTLNVQLAGSTFIFGMTFTGSKTSGTFTDEDGDTGTYTVSDRNVSFSYDDYDISFTGSFSTKDNMGGSVVVSGVTGTWNATRGITGAMAGSLRSIKATSKKDAFKSK
jgi:tetratricopeptide (TPR) repeat protein